ncbi:hypothetical protein Nmel_015521, partial [Mimus melanotis]
PVKVRLLPAVLGFGVYPLHPSALLISVESSPAATRLQPPRKQQVRVEPKVESEIYVSAKQAEK